MAGLRVFSDLHHTSLYNSLRILFEDRLSGQLFRPVGLEWWHKQLWSVYDHPATANQYLSLDQRYIPIDGSPQLNQVSDKNANYYEINDPEYGHAQKAVTYDQFMKMEFDIVLASLPQHIEPYQQLAIQKNAKFVLQVGNQWDGIHAPNIMASAKLHNVPADINWVEYHQEFDLRTFFPNKEYFPKSINSFMNIPEQLPDYKTLLEIEQQLPDWKVNIHGGMGRDGPLHGASSVAGIMKYGQFVWHVKAGGDGYGHILFNSAACGKPVIVKKSYYAGKLGEKLLIDGVTCIDIDGLSVPEIVEHIKYYSQPTRYAEMSKAVYKNFTEQVDFDEDEKKVRLFLNNLK